MLVSCSPRLLTCTSSLLVMCIWMNGISLSVKLHGLVQEYVLTPDNREGTEVDDRYIVYTYVRQVVLVG